MSELELDKCAEKFPMVLGQGMPFARPTRADVVRAARSYLDTPFHHAARTPGVGIDCAGVIVCAMRDLKLAAPDFDVAPYLQTPDPVTMLAECNTYMTRITRDAMQAGDAIVLITDTFPQHLGILGDYVHGGLSIIHAANNASKPKGPRVIETRLMFAQNVRFIAAYSLPGIA